MSMEAETIEKTTKDQLVSKGYKRTELGVIPIDWNLEVLENLVHFLDHQRMPVKSSDRARMIGEFPYYGASGIIDYVNDYIFDEELILFAEDGENIISRHLPLVFKVKGKIWVNNHAHILKPVEGVNIDYLTNFLESNDYKNYNTGTAQPKINRKSCGRIPVALPSNEEQSAIATALSDVDNLVESLDKLIAKKRAIKQATMQQLLTGKKRLPGFSGEWGKKRIGELANIRRGASPRPIDSPEWFDDNSNIGWVRIADIPFSSKYLYYTSQYLSQKGIDRSRFVQKGNLLMSIAASIGTPVLTKLDLCIHDGFVAFFDPKVDKDFLYYCLVFIKEDWPKYGQTGSQTNLNTDIIGNVEINIPSNKEEQARIANILSGIDNEIVALEKRKAKTQQIKEGMMQELLTGRTRLINTEKEMEANA